VAACESGARPDAKPFAKESDDLNDFTMLDSQSLQRLSFRECFATAYAAVALHGAVSVSEAAKLLGFAVAAVTFQLAFLGKAN
jgi:hypothetical protein